MSIGDPATVSAGGLMQSPDLKLGRRLTTVKSWLEGKPGAVGVPLRAPRGATPTAIIFKVMGKMFAILTIRSTESVILKCDPFLVPVLCQQYVGIGHRSHLDRRYWICVTLGADVPNPEIKRLVAQSYELVCATLTRKQKVELAAL